MVLESLVNPMKACKKPWVMLLVGFLYSSIGVFFALWVFREHADLVLVFFTVMAAMPFFYFTVKQEGKIAAKLSIEKRLMHQHSKALTSLLFLFLGFVLSFTLWYVVFPNAMSEATFAVQTNTILAINNNLSAQFANPGGAFIRILLNNIKVLTFCILFSFVYGLGAVFILTWNASIISVAIGNFIKLRMSTDVPLLLLITQGFLRYMIHGLAEILAYFVGGLAGGIISVAVINYSLRSKGFEKSLFDASQLVMIALFILLVAAGIEVYITPLLF